MNVKKTKSSKKIVLKITMSMTSVVRHKDSRRGPRMPAGVIVLR